MSTSELSAYITDARKVGIKEPEIIKQLQMAGWRDEAILNAMEEADQIFDGPIIQVQNLTKRYGDFVAVDGISFEVHRGETFGILGPNGAGKTTTLEMIEGLKKITSGTILVDGKDVEQNSTAVKSIIGVQLQASSFFEELKLAELIDVFASLYGKKVDAMKILDDVELTDKAGNYVKELSGGQKQRFSIAVGLVNTPKVLFLDEPTTGLDPQARRNLWELVTDIKKKGTTIVITTHYMDEAEILCDRIAIMDHAKIIALDTTSNLLKSIGVATTIEFTTSGNINAEVVKLMKGVQSATHRDGTFVVNTNDAQATLDDLFAAARKNNFTLDELRLKRATLEDVFLKLTGHQLRD